MGQPAGIRGGAALGRREGHATPLVNWQPLVGNQICAALTAIETSLRSRACPRVSRGPQPHASTHIQTHPNTSKPRQCTTETSFPFCLFLCFARALRGATWLCVGSLIRMYGATWLCFGATPLAPVLQRPALPTEFRAHRQIRKPRHPAASRGGRADGADGRRPGWADHAQRSPHQRRNTGVRRGGTRMEIAGTNGGIQERGSEVKPGGRTDGHTGVAQGTAPTSAARP